MSEVGREIGIEREMPAVILILKPVRLISHKDK